MTRINEGGKRVDVGTAHAASYDHVGMKNWHSCPFKRVHVDAEGEFHLAKQVMRCRHSVECRANYAGIGLTMGVCARQFDGRVLQRFCGKDVPGFKEVDWS